ncbi:MAG TPA: hypothetical protein VGM36_02215 [Rhizomicrobium sp.]|jgi:hypothetical protein
MSKHVAGMIGLLIGLTAVVIMGFLWDAMLKSIPHTKPKPYPKEVSVGLIPATPPAPPANP